MADYSVKGILKQQLRKPVYLTSGCCENAHGSEELFKKLKLASGIYAERFHPLTDSESNLISENYVKTGWGPLLLGYSALYRGKKWLFPCIEFPYVELGSQSPPTKTEATKRSEFKAAILVGDAVRHISKGVESIGGRVFVEWCMGPGVNGDRHEMNLLLPFQWFLDHDADMSFYNGWLYGLFA